jgi:membrane protease YdiL (CAAX protease family)
MTRLLLSPPPAARAEQPPRAAPWRHPAAQGPEAQRAILWAYLLLVVALSVFPWTMIIRAGSLQTSGGAFGLLLMWSPGVAAITVSLLLRRSLRGLGWRPGSWRYLLAGYALPPLYALVAYGAVWATRAGIFPRASAVDAVAQQYGLSGRTPGAIIGGWVAVTALLALVALLTALGEEIGWRGLLLPELARRMSWHGAALVSGAIWALWRRFRELPRRRSALVRTGELHRHGRRALRDRRLAAAPFGQPLARGAAPRRPQRLGATVFRPDHR